MLEKYKTVVLSSGGSFDRNKSNLESHHDFSFDGRPGSI